MNADRPVRRTLLATTAASFVVGAAVCATVLLYTNSHVVPRVAAGLVVGVVVVGVAAGKYVKRRAASGLLERSRLAALWQPPVPTPYLPPRQTSDDYWYPAAATRDRTGTRPRGPGL